MNTSTRHPLSTVLSSRPEGPMRVPARALGWFSIGLGLAELLMPRAVARSAGTPAPPVLVRACGLREIAVGTGLLCARDPQPWLWGRAAGDALDIAAVAGGMPLRGSRPARALVTLGVLGAILLIDAKCAAGAAPRRRRVAVRDYSARSGFPKPPAQMRGAARAA